MGSTHAEVSSSRIAAIRRRIASGVLGLALCLSWEARGDSHDDGEQEAAAATSETDLSPGIKLRIQSCGYQKTYRRSTDDDDDDSSPADDDDSSPADDDDSSPADDDDSSPADDDDATTPPDDDSADDDSAADDDTAGDDDSASDDDSAGD
jgi:ribonuclease E